MYQKGDEVKERKRNEVYKNDLQVAELPHAECREETSAV